MDFYMNIDAVYDRYDCKCGEDKWVLREFTPRNDPSEEEDELWAIMDEEDPSSFEFRPQDMVLLIDELSDKLKKCQLDQPGLKDFLYEITESELKFHYYVKVHSLYNIDSDSSMIIRSIHPRAMQYSFYADAMLEYIKNHAAFDTAYTVNIPKPQRPIGNLTQIDKYINRLFVGF
jgi:hypothetical protein